MSVLPQPAPGPEAGPGTGDPVGRDLGAGRDGTAPTPGSEEAVRSQLLPELRRHVSALLRWDVDAVEELSKVCLLLTDAGQADRAALALTRLAPRDTSGWVHLGDRVWLRQWPPMHPTCRYGPESDPADAAAALTLPVLSGQARRDGIVAVDDVAALADRAPVDHAELVAHGIGATCSAPLAIDATVLGSISWARAQARPWQPWLVGELHLLAEAAGARLRIEQAETSVRAGQGQVAAGHTRQRRFFAAVGHGLRTPLATILAACDSLADTLTEHRHDLAPAPKPLPGEPASAGHGPGSGHPVAALGDDLAAIRSAAEELAEVIDSVLAVATSWDAAAGPGHQDSADVHETMRDVHHWCVQEATAQRVLLELDLAQPGAPQPAQTVPAAQRANGAPVRVQMAAEPLRQILATLTSRLIAATAPGGQVTVSLTGTRLRPGHVRLLVSTSGPGLPEADARDLVAPADVRGTWHNSRHETAAALARANADRFNAQLGAGRASAAAGRVVQLWLDAPTAPGP